MPLYKNISIVKDWFSKTSKRLINEFIKRLINKHWYFDNISQDFNGGNNNNNLSLERILCFVNRKQICSVNYY